MKSFHDLTPDQKKKAIEYAKQELTLQTENGTIEFKTPRSEKVLADYAEWAARQAWYSGPNDYVVNGIAD